MMLPRACAILPAAGLGERMGLSTPKQFCTLLGRRPLLSHTIEAFECLSWIEHIVVVVSPERRSDVAGMVAHYEHQRVLIVDGAATRHRSIYAGVTAAMTACPGTEVLVVHDAVRLFVDEGTVLGVARAAIECGAAGVVRPLVSTVVAVDSDGFLNHALDRSKYRASEMPQAFRVDVLRAAYEKSTENDLDFGTECLHLVQAYTGVKVKLLDGCSQLWKVTHRRDLSAAESVLKETTSRVCVVYDEQSTELKDGFLGSLLDGLQEALDSKPNRQVPLQCCTVSEYMTLSMDGTVKAEPLNSIIFVHGKTCNTETITGLTKVVFKRLPCNHRTNAILVHLFIHLDSNMCLETKKFGIMEAVQQCGKCAHNLGLLVNGVIITNGDLLKSFKIISSLILERNLSYNGQTLLV